MRRSKQREDVPGLFYETDGYELKLGQRGLV
jgi:hypothetical protein